jgi:hypothetical protein
MQDRRRGMYESDDRRGRARSGFDRPNEDWRSRQFDEQRFRGEDRQYGDRYRGDIERSWRDQGDGFSESRDRWDEDRMGGFENENPDYSYQGGRYNEEYDRGYGREYGRSGEYGDRGFGREYGRSGEYGASWRSQPGGGHRESWQSGQHQTQAFGSRGPNWGARFGWGPSEQNYAGRGPKNYQRSDDRIREEISDRLTDDSRIDAGDVTVEVKNGEVTLSGTVSDRDQKRRAEDIAERVTGVREVNNNVRVSRSQEQDRGTTGTSRASGQSGTSTTRSKSGVEV